ncbi:MAG: hypothetical protein GVY12_13215 [Bacteroidetes bacterium]|jgi:hypothetical protein|nr:hypothetical protein [Bacteroidota bacterium]
MIAESVALFSALKDGITLVKQLESDRIDLRFAVKDFLISDSSRGRTAALAFVLITNASSRPHSITEIALKLGDEEVSRLPLKKLETQDMAGKSIKAVSHVDMAHFERADGQMTDLRVLPSDIYLRENESIGGCLLFMLPDVEPVTEFTLRLEVSGQVDLTQSVEA